MIILFPCDNLRHGRNGRGMAQLSRCNRASWAGPDDTGWSGRRWADRRCIPEHGELCSSSSNQSMNEAGMGSLELEAGETEHGSRAGIWTNHLRSSYYVRAAASRPIRFSSLRSAAGARVLLRAESARLVRASRGTVPSGLVYKAMDGNRHDARRMHAAAARSIPTQNSTSSQLSRAWPWLARQVLDFFYFFFCFFVFSPFSAARRERERTRLQKIR